MVRTTADTGLSGAACTTAVKPSQLVQSSSENDIICAWVNGPASMRRR
nr:NTP-binding protein [Aeromonas caviae]